MVLLSQASASRCRSAGADEAVRTVEKIHPKHVIAMLKKNIRSGRKGWRFLQNTVVINRCTLELTPPVLYRPGVVRPSHKNKEFYKKNFLDKITFSPQNRYIQRNTSCFNQFDTLLNKVEACLIQECWKEIHKNDFIVWDVKMNWSNTEAAWIRTLTLLFFAE